MSLESFGVARGVQYVHCVMHKCIVVKLGGNEKHIKYVKNTNILQNQGEIVKLREERIILAK